MAYQKPKFLPCTCPRVSLLWGSYYCRGSLGDQPCNRAVIFPPQIKQLKEDSNYRLLNEMDGGD